VFTLFVLEIEIIATLKKKLVLVVSLIVTGKLFQSLHPLYINMFYKIQCLVSTVLMSCCNLTLENNENLKQTEKCHLDIHVHCHLKYEILGYEYGI